MDVEAIRVLAAKLDGQAQRLTSVITHINGLVDGLPHVWSGPDAQDFVGWWQNKHRPALQGAHDSVAGLAQSAKNNAAEQEKTSSTSGSSGSTSGGDPAGLWRALVTASPLAESLTPMPGHGPSLHELNGLIPLLVAVPAVSALVASYGAGVAVNAVEDKMDEVLPGSSNLVMDGLGVIGGRIGDAAGYADMDADATKAVQHLMSGSYSDFPRDMLKLGDDALGFTVVGRVESAGKFGMDVGYQITQIPAVHHELDSFSDWVVQRGEEQGGDIGTRYDGVGGVFNWVTDATGLSSIF